MAPPGGADYFAVGGGGKLKLKGGTKDGRVDKKKKKRKDKEKEQEEEENRVDLSKENESEPQEDGNQEKAPEDDGDDPHPKKVYKTEAERNHDEKRRKRLNERLKREGVKTHKERVEELNRYLSNLSEHHDMPKIGPG